jgi:hypothetical protein
VSPGRPPAPVPPCVSVSGGTAANNSNTNASPQNPNPQSGSTPAAPGSTTAQPGVNPMTGPCPVGTVPSGSTPPSQ